MGTALLIFLGPAALVLFVVRIVPVVIGFGLAFVSWNGSGAPVFVGLDNFGRLLNDPLVFRGVTNNVIILACLELSMVVSFLIAALLHERIPGWRFFRACFLLPVLLSPLVVGIYWGLGLSNSGFVNVALQGIGLGSLAQDWLGSPVTALGWLTAIVIWSSFGVGVVIFLAALADLNQEVMDAGRVDGASWWQIQWHIVAPEMFPVMRFWGIILLIIAFTSLFPLVQVITSGGPGTSTITLEWELHKVAFGLGSIGYASAIGTVSLLVVLSVAVVVAARVHPRDQDRFGS